MSPACATCMHSVPVADSSEGARECRRLPPVPSTHLRYAEFPIVRPTWLCGEHAATATAAIPIVSIGGVLHIDRAYVAERQRLVSLGAEVCALTCTHRSFDEQVSELVRGQS